MPSDLAEFSATELVTLLVTLAAEDEGLEDSELELVAISQISKDVAFVITFVNVSSDEVKMPSSAKWLVEAELVDPAIEEACVPLLKGQLISKCVFGVSNSLKKQT